MPSNNIFRTNGGGWSLTRMSNAFYSINLFRANGGWQFLTRWTMPSIRSSGTAACPGPKGKIYIFICWYALKTGEIKYSGILLDIVIPQPSSYSSIHSCSLFYIFLLPSFYILSFHSLEYSLSLSPFHPPCILSLPSYILYMGASTLFTFLSMTKSFSLIATSGDLSITKMSHCSAASFHEKRYPKYWLYACKNCAKYLTLQKSSFASSLFNWEITQPLLAQVLYVYSNINF